MTEDTTTELDAAIAQLPGFGWGFAQAGAYGSMTADYWHAAGRGELTVPQCDNCRTFRWPPNDVCYACHSMDWHWQQVPATGTVYTYVWADNPPVPGQPVYNMTVVELDIDQAEPVRVLSSVLDATKENLHCGERVSVKFESVGAGLAVPMWTLGSI